MPEPKKNIALPVAQQEQIDRINRQAQLENLYNKYPSEVAVPIPTPDLSTLQKVINLFNPTKASPQDIAVPTSTISDEEALKLNTEAGQLMYLQQEALKNKLSKPTTVTGARG